MWSKFVDHGFAKAATKFFPTEAPFLLDLKKSLREAQTPQGLELGT